MTEDDLVALVLEEQLTGEEGTYELCALQVTYGTTGVPSATVTLKTKENEEIQEAATGNGSVEAIYNTLERCLKQSVTLLDYRIQSNSGGRDALAQVYVKVNVDGIEMGGRGIAQDVLEASAKAYLNAVNRAILLKHTAKEKHQATV